MISTTMPSDVNLTREVLANPNDLVARAIYADWLEERGEEERADALRKTSPHYLLPGELRVHPANDGVEVFVDQEWVGNVPDVTVPTCRCDGTYPTDIEYIRRWHGWRWTCSECQGEYPAIATWEQIRDEDGEYQSSGWTGEVAPCVPDIDNGNASPVTIAVGLLRTWHMPAASLVRSERDDSTAHDEYITDWVPWRSEMDGWTCRESFHLQGFTIAERREVYRQLAEGASK